MGVIKNYRCPECGKSWEIHEGQGLGGANEAFVLKSFLEERQSGVKAALDMAGPFGWRLAFIPAVCNNCHNLTSIPKISLRPSGKVIYGNCGICTSDNFFEKESSDILCPSCGSKKLVCEEIGSWD